MKLKKKHLNKKIRLPISLILAFFFLASLYCLYYIYQKPTEIEKEVPTYKYEHQGDITYKAIIKPNSIFKKTTLGPGETIYRKLLDSFTTIYTYQFKTEQPAEIKGSYNVIATLEAKDMWKKDYILVPETPFSQTGQKVSFRNERPIVLDYFEQVIEQVDEELGVNAREPILTITTNINLEANTGEQILKETMAPTMIIPLTSGSLNIKDGEPSVKKEGTLTQIEIAPNPIKGYFIYIQYTTIMSGVLLLLFLLFTQNKPLKQDQRKNTKKFWKEFWKKYGDRIIKTNDELVPADFITVNSMDDLVRVSDELAKPIIYKEAISTKPTACYIFDGSTAYKHVISINNEETKQEINFTGRQTENPEISL